MISAAALCAVALTLGAPEANAQNPRPPYASFGSVRLHVKPKNAQVYVDGYFMGTVDDLDGPFQRLEIPPGEHDVAIYLVGYKTMTQRLLVRPRTTLEIKNTLQPLAPGESMEPRPQPQDVNLENLPPSTIAFRVQPRDATLLVDGQEWSGVADASGQMLIEVSEGSHEIEVRKEGFVTVRRTVRVRRGETLPLNINLSR